MSWSASCRRSSWNLGQWGLPVAVSVQLGVRLLGCGATLGGPPTAAAQVNLLDRCALAEVGRARCRDGQQDLLADLGMPLGSLVLQRLEPSRQLGHHGSQ